MRQLTGFMGEIERRLERAEVLRRREAAQLADTMQPREDIRLAFERVAEIVHSAIIRPRCEALSQRFAHVALTHLATPHSVYTMCTFCATERFPATAVMTMGVALDEECPRCVLFYSCDLTPGLIGYERRATIEVRLEAPPWDELADWVEANILRVVETYLEVERHPAYQQHNVAVDPVCGMIVPLTAAEECAVHAGRRFYFCAPGCRERFTRQPELFLAGVVELPTSHTGGDQVSNDPTGQRRRLTPGM